MYRTIHLIRHLLFLTTSQNNSNRELDSLGFFDDGLDIFVIHCFDSCRTQDRNLHVAASSLDDFEKASYGELECFGFGESFCEALLKILAHYLIIAANCGCLPLGAGTRGLGHEQAWLAIGVEAGN